MTVSNDPSSKYTVVAQDGNIYNGTISLGSVIKEMKINGCGTLTATDGTVSKGIFESGELKQGTKTLSDGRPITWPPKPAPGEPRPVLNIAGAVTGNSVTDVGDIVPPPPDFEQPLVVPESIPVRV